MLWAQARQERQAATLCEQRPWSCIHARRTHRSRRSICLSALVRRCRTNPRISDWPVERTAPDEVYACRLWFDGVELIHVYQTDTSSKPPAPKHLAKKNVVENQNNRIITLDESRSISGWVLNPRVTFRLILPLSRRFGANGSRGSQHP